MTHTLRKAFLATVLAMFSLLANAEDFSVDNIYYNITSSADLTVEVTSYCYYTDEYKGDMSIPATVKYNGSTYAMTTIGDYAFDGCSGLTSLTSQTTTPPTCGTDALTDIDKESSVLHILESTTASYKSASQWQDIYDIVDDAIGINTITANAAVGVGVKEVSCYNVHGQCIDGAQRSVNIIRYSDGNTKKVIVEKITL